MPIIYTFSRIIRWQFKSQYAIILLLISQQFRTKAVKISFMNQNPNNRQKSGVKLATQRRSNARPDSSNEEFLANLSSAIRNDELLIHYQPRYDTLTGRANFFEAMVRWERPGLGSFYPPMFLKAAETHGLIFSIDLWVFEQCCKDLIRFRKTISKRLKLSINVSSLDCESVYYSQKLIDLCSAYNLTLEDFEFEISESYSVSDMRKLSAFCQTLSEHGTTFCLDNFGTGHAPMSRLLELPIDKIKIDRCFIERIGENKRNDVIIKSLYRLAKDLDIKVVATGVESKQQYDFLNQLGCDEMQGFYFSSPRKLEKINKSELFISDDNSFR